ALAVSDSDERAQTPAARCRKRRRGSFILLSLTKAASGNRHLHLLHDVRGRTVAFAPSPRRGEGCSAFSTPRNGGGGSGPSAPPVTPSPHPSSPKRGEGAHRACRTFIDTRFATRDAYSDLTAAALMIGVQRAISSLTSAARGCWPRRGFSGISLPSSSRRFCVAASSSALSSAALSASTIGLGVPLGANNAFQADAWNCASPAAVDVGSSGSAALRVLLPIA